MKAKLRAAKSSIGLVLDAPRSIEARTAVKWCRILKGLGYDAYVVEESLPVMVGYAIVTESHATGAAAKALYEALFNLGAGL